MCDIIYLLRSIINNLKIGTKLVEAGKVYTIYRINEEKADGKTRRIICYKPHYSNISNNTVICSLPENNLTEANVRQPISAKELKEIIEGLSGKSRYLELDAIEAKLILESNSIYETAEIIKRCWREKSENEEGFTKTKRDILELAIDKIVEEVALVGGTSLDTARLTITKALS